MANEDREWILGLCVAGQTPKSLTAVTTIGKICEERLKGRYELDVVDIYRQPMLAQGGRGLAIAGM